MRSHQYGFYWRYTTNLQWTYSNSSGHTKCMYMGIFIVSYCYISSKALLHGFQRTWKILSMMVYCTGELLPRVNENIPDITWEKFTKESKICMYVYICMFMHMCVHINWVDICTYVHIYRTRNSGMYIHTHILVISNHPQFWQQRRYTRTGLH